MRELTMRVGGMSCGHCVAAVRGALEALPGVFVEQVEIGSARVRYDADRVDPERIAQAVRDEGYQPAV